MNIGETFKVSVEALMANKVRSALTMLGVIIGVTAVILLVSVGEGARKYIETELTGLGSNLLIITPGKVDTKGGFRPHSVGTVRKLSYDDALFLKRRSQYLKEAVPVILGTANIKYKNLSRDTTVIGITPEYLNLRILKIESGSFVTQVDIDTKKKVIVMGKTTKKELFGHENALGKLVTVGESRYRVVGIMATKGVSLGMDFDDIVFIPVTSAEELFDTDKLFEIISSVKRPENLNAAIAEIKELLIKRHSNKEDFTITSQSDILSTMQTILTIMTGVLAGIAGISLVVGGIGIMNIMLVSVRERTREIGIRKAIGARHKDILVQFLIESITLSVVGGIIGIILGGGLSVLIPFFLPFYLPTQVTLWSVLLAFFFSMAVGIFFGIYPARKASLLDPIESLRYE